jgi:hypothetical protein
LALAEVDPSAGQVKAAQNDILGGVIELAEVDLGRRIRACHSIERWSAVSSGTGSE